MHPLVDRLLDKTALVVIRGIQMTFGPDKPGDRLAKALQTAYTGFRMGWLGWEADAWKLRWPGRRTVKYGVFEFHKDDQGMGTVIPWEAVGWHVSSGGASYNGTYPKPWAAAEDARKYKCRTR